MFYNILCRYIAYSCSSCLNIIIIMRRAILVCRESRVHRWQPRRRDIYNIMQKYIIRYMGMTIMKYSPI